jgi:hypothetical protein
VDETDPIVWTDILLNVRKLLKVLELTNIYEQFKAFAISLLTPVSTRIGIEKSDKDSTLMLMHALL